MASPAILPPPGMGKLKPLDIPPGEKAWEPSRIKVKLDFSNRFRINACPLFVGRLIRNIKNGPSPEWLQQRLRAVGLRPISALVDITNYMTFDCARPLHVFDAKKIRGHLWLRPAQGGETLAALNGKSYTLEKGMTVIGRRQWRDQPRRHYRRRKALVATSIRPMSLSRRPISILPHDAHGTRFADYIGRALSL